MAAKRPKPIPTGWIGGPSDDVPRVRRTPLRRHGSADWADPQRNWYPSRGELDPSQSVGTPTKFHPNELPDPRAAFVAGMLPQVIPAHQIDPTYENHVLDGSVPPNDPVRLRYQK